MELFHFTETYHNFRIGVFQSGIYGLYTLVPVDSTKLENEKMF
jgi:hypothetical protein